jgi:hypothetical protein
MSFPFPNNWDYRPLSKENFSQEIIARPSVNFNRVEAEIGQVRFADAFEVECQT